VGAGHRLHLHVEGTTVLHRMPPHAKLVGLTAFVLGVASVPPTARAALGLLVMVALVVLVSTKVSARHLLRRMVVELPFVVFAVVLPFVASGPRIDIGALVVSRPGVDAAVALLLKGTCGAAVAVAFAVTTQPRDFLRALEELRVPAPLVAIASFMVRYVAVVSDQMRRMRVARESRAFVARSPRSWRWLAAAVGALFIRSYERGERVHLAMLSRGWSGRFPVTDRVRATSAQWALACAPALLAGLISAGVRLA
jgi:cobalt/nickel transport system permease protein